MIGWILLVILAIGLCILGIYIGKKYSNSCDGNWMAGVVLTVVGGIAAVVLIIVTISMPFDIKAKINTFERQKIYFETHVAKNDIEDAALTSGKIERNNWLYTAQYDAENYKWFVPYADRILSLEEIQ